ncbi:MAG: hypothetical protein J6V38_07750 [Kiritimatiellae bacterium]|nr:hypothetical protein [Kiritimatiellia bacterium]
MERIIKTIAMIEYMFSVSDDLDEKETLDEIEDRIRSGEYFPTDVANCKLVSVVPQ